MRMKGFALIEVLVALFILSLGLLGIAGMQLSALQHSQEGYWHSLASTQVSSMFERLRANESSTARENEFVRWNAINARLLPSGSGHYSCNTGMCTVTVQWATKKTHVLSVSGGVG